MDTLDQLNVVSKLTNNELKMVEGGGLSGTIVNAFTSAFKALYGFGQEFGSSIRRIRKRKLCSL